MRTNWVMSKEDPYVMSEKDTVVMSEKDTYVIPKEATYAMSEKSTDVMPAKAGIYLLNIDASFRWHDKSCHYFGMMTNAYRYMALSLRWHLPLNIGASFRW